jgi:hypothetical protein
MPPGGQELELAVMSKNKGQAEEAGPEASRRVARKQPKAADAAVQAAIGNRLRAYYAGVAQEPVPDRFVELLKRLDSSDSKESDR